MGLCSSKAANGDTGGVDPEDLNSSFRSGGKNNEAKGDKFQYVIVGFGVAGGYAAKQLADLGVKEFEVAIVGEEPTFAYERPALSKGYLFPPGIPDKMPARLPRFHTCSASGDVIQTEEWYQDRNWTCYLSTKVLAVDFKRKTLRCQGPNNEEWVRYEKLIICTGSKPNRLTCPGSNLKNVYYLRNEQEAATIVRKLERETGNRFHDRKLAPMKGSKSGVLQSTRRLGKDEARELTEMMKGEEENEDEANDHAVVLGGGYLGVEVACAIYGWGFSEVHLVFRGTHVYQKLPWDSRFREKVQAEIMKRAPNLILHPDTTVEKLLPREESSQYLGSAELSDGTTVVTHTLVAAIGATPSGKEILPKKGVTYAKNGNTVVVDEGLRLKSSDTKDVWVCGELAKGECGVEAARAMGKHAAKNAYQSLTGEYASAPFKIDYAFRYSRLFEYTTNPLIWYQIGDVNTSDPSTFVGENNECGETGPFGVFYTKKEGGPIIAALVCGAFKEKELLDGIRALVEKGDSTVEEAKKLFTEKGFST